MYSKDMDSVTLPLILKTGKSGKVKGENGKPNFQILPLSFPISVLTFQLPTRVRVYIIR